MSDELLDYLSGQYIQHDVWHKKQQTFEQYINSYNAGLAVTGRTKELEGFS